MNNKERSSDEFYCPVSISTWRRFLGNLIDKDVSGVKDLYSFKSNLGYNLQHLEYLDNLLKTQKLHASVRTLTFKTFVVFGMSVMEGILFYVIGKKSKRKEITWTEDFVFTSNFKEYKGKTTRIRNTIEVKLLKPTIKPIDLSEMIKTVVNKKLIPSEVSGTLYKDLSELRILRNKIHIHGVDGSCDTDWNSFSEKEWYLIKEVLFGLLGSDLFLYDKNDNILNFLMLETN